MLRLPSSRARFTRRILAAAWLTAGVLFAACRSRTDDRSTGAHAGGTADGTKGMAVAAAPPCDNAGLTLPNGFCATVFADSIGHARHLAVSPNGTV